MARRRPAEESLLFDLPLDRPPVAEAEPAPIAEIDQPPLPLAPDPRPGARDGSEVAPAPTLPREPGDREAVIPDSHALEPDATTVPPPRPGGPPAAATLRLRAGAGLADLGVCAAVMVVLLVAVLAQGIQPESSDWPAAVLFLLTFSFLYAVLPLAFWGRTPGMALAGLRSTGKDGKPLTFRQAVLSWLGSVLTVACGGLPLLLALGGRSLADLVSGSITRRFALRR